MDDNRTIVVHVGGVPMVAWLLNKVWSDSATTLAQAGIGVLSSAEISKTLTGGRPNAVDVPALSELIRAEFDGAPDGGPVHTVVGSTESLLRQAFDPAADGLFPDARPMLEQLDAATSGLRRIIVLSVCAPSQFLELYYRRMVRAHDWVTFDGWLAGLDLERLSWTPLHRTLTDIFGADSVRIVRFDEAGGRPAVVEQFARISGADRTTLAPVPPVNAELSAKGLELGAAAREHLRSWADRDSMRAFLMGHFSNRHYPALVSFTEQARTELDSRYPDEPQPAGAAR